MFRVSRGAARDGRPFAEDTQTRPSPWTETPLRRTLGAPTIDQERAATSRAPGTPAGAVATAVRVLPGEGVGGVGRYRLGPLAPQVPEALPVLSLNVVRTPRPAPAVQSASGPADRSALDDQHGRTTIALQGSARPAGK